MPPNLFSSIGDTGLKSSIRGLYATPTAPLPFLSGVVVRSFILERKQGNIIIYTQFSPEAENPWVKLYENCR